MYDLEEASPLQRPQTPSVNGSGTAAKNHEPVAAAPYVGALTAARRHPLLVLVTVIVCVGAAIAAGLHRSPQYSATTHLQISVNLNAPGALTGFSTATASLASSYSRAVSAQSVVAPVARSRHLTPQAVRSRVSATPVPDSPLFRITASGKTAKSAIALANSVSHSLLTFVDDGSSPADRLSRSLYKRYRKIASARIAADLRAKAAAKRYADHKSSANFNALRDARTAAQSAQLRASTVGSAYQAATRSQGSMTDTTLLSPAEQATSDRKSKLELFGFIGLLAGIAVGLALATIRANRRGPRPAGS